MAFFRKTQGTISKHNIRNRTRLRSAVLLLSLGAIVPATLLVGTTSSAQAGLTSITTTGLTPGSIQHVWLIILENKSYDETFTGLNNNSYLWQTLPSEGVLLQNYHGTGHSSMDNYIALASGQAPVEDTQEDCSDVNTQLGSNSTIVTASADESAGGTGTIGGATPNWNYGQILSALGANAP